MIRKLAPRKLLPKKASKPAPQIVPDDLDNLGKTQLTDDLFTQVAKALTDQPKKLAELLEPLHPADIADILERLSRKSRKTILHYIPLEHMGEVISELETGVQEHVINLLKPQELKEAISELDSNDAADLAQIVEDVTDENGPEAADLITDHQSKRLLHYETDTAGGLMQLEVVTAPPEMSVADMLAVLRDTEGLPTKPGTVFVVNENRKLLGTLSLSRIVQMPLSASLEAVMRKNPLTVTPEMPATDVVTIFEKYDIHNLAVLNNRGQLLGRITIDDILDVVMEQAARQRARAAGVDESEDLFAPALQTARHRMPWLIINLGTAIAAASVIALFEGTIAQLTTLAVLMPIVTSMGGNATTQTQTIVIRGLALGQITRQNALPLLWKEFTVGAYKGFTLGFLIAIGTWAFYHQPMLAAVIALATIANHFIAAFAGWATPLVLKKYNFDPAIATGVITTTFTDVGGFFVFLSLATLLLL